MAWRWTKQVLRSASSQSRRACDRAPEVQAVPGSWASGRRPFRVSNVVHRRISSSVVESWTSSTTHWEPSILPLSEASRCDQAPSPKLPYVRLQRISVVLTQSDINNFSTDFCVQDASGSPFDCKCGQAGLEAERTASELAMTRLVASPRREVLCPVRQSFSPAWAAEDLHQTALCDLLLIFFAGRGSRVNSAAERL